MSERVTPDLEVLSELPDGEAHLNLLEDSTRHGLAGPLPFQLTAELREWLENKLKGSGLKVEAAGIEMSYRTDAVPTVRRRIVLFDLLAESTISAEGRSWRGKPGANSIWYRRAGR